MRFSYNSVFLTIMIIATLIILVCLLFRPRPDLETLRAHAQELRLYAETNDYNQCVAIMVDYGIPSGANRLFVWDLQNDQLLYSCLVAHGRGHIHDKFAPVHFSNEEGSHLSSLGRCRIAERYHGHYGLAYRLDGLDSTNSNVRKRCIVLHAHKAVPKFQIFPFRIIHSQGCVMVSRKAMTRIDELIRDEQNVLLQTYFGRCKGSFPFLESTD